MAIKPELKGKTYDPVEYEVGREKIREYAYAVGEQDAIYHEPDAAQAAGFRNVVAPPMFCVVYSARAIGPAILDPELAINLGLMVHGSQEFEWGEPVVAGDLITTEAKIKDLYEKGSMELMSSRPSPRTRKGRPPSRRLGRTS